MESLTEAAAGIVRGAGTLRMVGAQSGSDWLVRFHAGDRAVIEGCYREHYGVVDRAVGSVLSGADRETVVHEVFFRLLTRAELRENFRGGSLSAWLSTVAGNLAIDHQRRSKRERSLPPEEAAAMESAARFDEAADARMLIDR